MDVIVVDSDMAAKLKGLHGQVELHDPSGKKLGKFVPVVDLTGWEAVTPDITEEGRKQLMASDEPRYCTQEVLAHLEAVHVQSLAEKSGPSGHSQAGVQPVLDVTPWLHLTPEISDEERARRKASTEPRLTKQELLASLDNLHVKKGAGTDWDRREER